MTVRQIHGEAGQFPVTGQDAPDFLKAVQIAVVERRCLVQLRRHCHTEQVKAVFDRGEAG